MSFLLGEQMTGGYGAADILHDCSIGVEKGEIAVIVGPNGAGKSTAMKAVFGMLPLRKGHVMFDGEDIHTRVITLFHRARQCIVTFTSDVILAAALVTTEHSEHAVIVAHRGARSCL